MQTLILLGVAGVAAARLGDLSGDEMLFAFRTVGS